MYNSAIITLCPEVRRVILTYASAFTQQASTALPAFITLLFGRHTGDLRGPTFWLLLRPNWTAKKSLLLRVVFYSACSQ